AAVFVLRHFLGGLIALLRIRAEPRGVEIVIGVERPDALPGVDREGERLRVVDQFFGSVEVSIIFARLDLDAGLGEPLLGGVECLARALASGLPAAGLDEGEALRLLTL